MCRDILAPLADINPCVPSPCGPYSVCKEINGHGVCSCQEGYSGSPPMCRPECVISTDCPQHQACIQQKCKDPCPGTCGVNARCHVINHNPICTCRAGFTGDPFVTCQLEQSKVFFNRKNEIKFFKFSFKLPILILLCKIFFLHVSTPFYISVFLCIFFLFVSLCYFISYTGIFFLRTYL